MSNGPLTRKQVAGTFTATFEGNYIPKESIEDYLNQWLDAGLEDRDDLRGWSFDIVIINETLMEEED